MLLEYWMSNKYTLRYTGGMVPDVYYILVKGAGVFCNPSSPSHRAKLRLLYECAPIAMVSGQFVLLHFKAKGAVSDDIYIIRYNVCKMFIHLLVALKMHFFMHINNRLFGTDYWMCRRKNYRRKAFVPFGIASHILNRYYRFLCRKVRVRVLAAVALTSSWLLFACPCRLFTKSRDFACAITSFLPQFLILL